jgi:hypothetical protein
MAKSCALSSVCHDHLLFYSRFFLFGFPVNVISFLPGEIQAFVSTNKLVPVSLAGFTMLVRLSEIGSAFFFSTEIANGLVAKIYLYIIFRVRYHCCAQLFHGGSISTIGLCSTRFPDTHPVYILDQL